ncbi:DUF2510 domain-containing protein [Microbacterium sp. SD291]|nr:DUF2510 domain-containing protein [Microbacterium sp. SD291]
MTPNPVTWHPDPTGRHERRYWDGVAWTDHVWTAGQQSKDATRVPCVPVPVLERAGLEPLRDPPGHPAHPVRGLRLREPDQLRRERLPIRRVVEVGARVEDHPHLRSGDPPRTLRLPQQRELLHQERCFRHPPLHGPVRHPQRRPELRGHGTQGKIGAVQAATVNTASVITAVGVALPGDVQREPGPDREHPIPCGLQPADRALDLHHRIGERTQRPHLLDRCIHQRRHDTSTPGATDIPTPDQRPKTTPQFTGR